MEDLGLHLELKDGDGLVHHCRKTGVLLVEFLTPTSSPRHELRTGIITVGLHGKGGQGNEVDAIRLFECSEVRIAQTKTDDVTDAGIVSCAGTHPENVMVTPLDIPVLVLTQQVEDQMSPRTAVVDVS